MLSAIGQTSALQNLTALRAFKSAEPKKENNVEQNIPENRDEVNTEEANILFSKIDVNELRECATKVGEYNISDEDIKYGLMYGRSVIAAYDA